MIIAVGFNTNEPNYMNNLNVAIHRHNMRYANDEILTIATAFMTNEPKIWGEYWKYLYLTIHKTQYLYEVWSTEGFIMNSDEISKNAIVLNANEPK